MNLHDHWLNQFDPWFGFLVDQDWTKLPINPLRHQCLVDLIDVKLVVLLVVQLLVVVMVAPLVVLMVVPLVVLMVVPLVGEEVV